MLDPRTNAVRGDIADIRLAEQVFAPHYVAPMERRIAVATTLSQAADDGTVPLAAGDRFDVLDISGETAWGIAVAAGLVGYVPAAAVEDLEP